MSIVIFMVYNVRRDLIFPSGSLLKSFLRMVGSPPSKKVGKVYKSKNAKTDDVKM